MPNEFSINWKSPGEFRRETAEAQGKELTNEDAAFKLQQMQDLNALVTKHTDAQGKLNRTTFFQDPELKAKRLGQAALGYVLSNATSTAQAMTDVAQQGTAQRSMGYDPDKSLPEQPLPSAKTVYADGTSTPSGPGAGGLNDPKTRAAVTDYLGRFSGRAGAKASVPAPTHGSASIPAAPDEANTVRVPGAVGGMDGAGQGMEPPQQKYGQLPKEDLLTEYQRSYDPSKTPGASMAGAGAAVGAGGPPSLASDTARATKAQEYMRNGLLSEADKDNPEAFQAALGKDWSNQVAAVGPAPNFSMFLKAVKPGDPSGVMTAQAEFQKAMQEWTGKQMGLAKSFYGGAGDAYDKQLTQSQSVDANNRANTSQGWTKEGRDTVTKLGMDPNRVTPEQATELLGRKNTLDGMDRMLDEAKKALMGQVDPYAQRAAITAVLNNLSQVENVGTEAGNARMNTLLEFAPGALKAFQERGISAVPEAFAKSIAANPEQGYLALKAMVKMTKSDGILSGQLRAAGMQNPFGASEPPAGGGNTPQVGTTKRFPNGKTATWDGHGWRAQ